MGSIPGLGRSPRGGHSNPLQYFCLENSMSGRAWWAMVLRVTKSWTRLMWLSMHMHVCVCVSVQFSLVVQSCLTLCNPMDCSTQISLSITNSCSLLKLMSISQWCHTTISSSLVPFSSYLQSFPASVFSNESVLCIRWPKYWSFSFSISLSIEYSGLISFRIDWLDLLTVQGTLKSLLQHHSSKASIFWCSAFFYSPTLTSTHDYWKNHSFH